MIDVKGEENKGFFFGYVSMVMCSRVLGGFLRSREIIDSYVDNWMAIQHLSFLTMIYT
jgi:hypothetical protein